MIDWQPIETAPRDGRDVLIYVDQATVPLVRLAWWDDRHDEPEWYGWWSNDSSVGSVLIEWTPTHWAVWEGPRA